MPASSTYTLLTAAGPAGIAILRLSGLDVPAFVARHLRLRRPVPFERAGGVGRAALVDAAGETLDEILVSMHGGTPVPDIRLHLHGSPWLIRRVQELLATVGFSESSPSAAELWRVQDGLEAEAVDLLPRVLTLRGTRWLLARVEKLRAVLQDLLSRAGGATKASETAGELPGSRADRETCRALANRLAHVDWFTRPARIALVGPPNAGKSTLANALADRAVSLVSAKPGTTRDWVEAPAEPDGFPVVWLDTAGLRPEADGLEAAGIARTWHVLAEADASVVVLDSTPGGIAAAGVFSAVYAALRPTCTVLNKVDDPSADPAGLAAKLPPDWGRSAVTVSAISRTGLGSLVTKVLEALSRYDPELEMAGAFTGRQSVWLETAFQARGLDEYRTALAGCLRYEFPPAGPASLASSADGPI